MNTGLCISGEGYRDNCIFSKNKNPGFEQVKNKNKYGSLKTCLREEVGFVQIFCTILNFFRIGLSQQPVTQKIKDIKFQAALNKLLRKSNFLQAEDSIFQSQTYLYCYKAVTPKHITPLTKHTPHMVTGRLNSLFTSSYCNFYRVLGQLTFSPYQAES